MDKCEHCEGKGKILVTPKRLMGATYPPEDPYKGDEHWEECPVCQPPSVIEEMAEKLLVITGMQHDWLELAQELADMAREGYVKLAEDQSLPNAKDKEVTSSNQLDHSYYSGYEAAQQDMKDFRRIGE